jgi:hypothetical protein
MPVSQQKAVFAGAVRFAFVAACVSLPAVSAAAQTAAPLDTSLPPLETLSETVERPDEECATRPW